MQGRPLSEGGFEPCDSIEVVGSLVHFSDVLRVRNGAQVLGVDTISTSAHVMDGLPI